MLLLVVVEGEVKGMCMVIYPATENFFRSRGSSVGGCGSATRKRILLFHSFVVSLFLHSRSSAKEFSSGGEVKFYVEWY